MSAGQLRIGVFRRGFPQRLPNAHSTYGRNFGGRTYHGYGRTPRPFPNPTSSPSRRVRKGADLPLDRRRRTTPAINYRPRKGATKIDFVGTALLPNAVGTAQVEGKKGYIAIDARFDKLEPATRFGQEYLTYVLWAITPEGRATNLGEVQVDDKDARIQVTTELQAFGLILTAEPYFAVTQPSDVVVMENIVRAGTVGTSEVIQAKYELLNRGSYLMRQDASQLKRQPLEPGAPLDLAEARNAVALAQDCRRRPLCRRHVHEGRSAPGDCRDGARSESAVPTRS